MNLFEMSPRLVAFALTAFSLSGCVVGAGSGSGSGSAPAPAPLSPGTISVLSSIEGSTHPSECDYVGATDLELAVYEGSSLYTTVTASCYDFQLTVALPDGGYNADATLLDGHSQPVSTTLTLDNLRVVAGTDLQVDIDFPASSILPCRC